MDIQMPNLQPPPSYNNSNELVSLHSFRSDNEHSSTTTRSASTNLPTSNEVAPRNIPNTVINLTNSSDVVIGPMTQYQGPVTIYQYMDATVDNIHRRLPLEARGNRQSETQPSGCLIDIRKHWIQILAVIAIVLGISSSVYFTFFARHPSNETPIPILFSKNYDSDTCENSYPILVPNLGNGHLIVDHKNWGSSNFTDITRMTKLVHPIPLVLIGHVGVQSKPCFTIYTCSIKIRSVQDNAVASKSLPEIGGNFYIGGDGNIYVGRGWNYVNNYGNKTLAIIFLGDYLRYEPEETQFEALDHLLTYGLIENYLSKDYNIIGLNQTKISKYSPGIHIMKRLVKYPRWIPCGNENYAVCGSSLGIKWNKKE